MIGLHLRVALDHYLARTPDGKEGRSELAKREKIAELVTLAATHSQFQNQKGAVAGERALARLVQRDHTVMHEMRVLFRETVSQFGLTSNEVLEEMQRVYADLQVDAKTEEMLTRTVNCLGDANQLLPGEAENMAQRIAAHRTGQAADGSSYKSHRLIQEHAARAKKGLITQFVRRNGRAPNFLEQVAIAEEATHIAYSEHLPRNVEMGFFDPRVIPFEMLQDLGVATEIPAGINTLADAKGAIAAELGDLCERGLINPRQRDEIQHEVDEALDDYAQGYPDKTTEQAYLIGRDMARIAVYQEKYDKSAFSGSDHGSKHIHHNIRNAVDMIEGIDEKDLTAKDRFVVRLVQFFHDTGYATGLAQRDFGGMKDHPTVSAKMFEENRDFFVQMTDEASYDAAHKSILFHAIMQPHIVPGEEKDGVHYSMIRALTSISDACAVSYDRKTQEFWEQPEAVMLLARFKMFLLVHPEAQGVLMNPAGLPGKIEEAQAEVDAKPGDQGLINRLDALKEAQERYQQTKEKLHALVAKTQMPASKRQAFDQAIEAQFNAFTPKITLGQYGAVQEGLGVRKLWTSDSGEGAKYKTIIKMAPSLIYGVLEDLFGSKQAGTAFDKLAEEFGIEGDDLDMLHMAIQAKGSDMTNGADSGETVELEFDLCDWHILAREDAVRAPKTWNPAGTETVDLTDLHAALKGVQQGSLRHKIFMLDTAVRGYVSGKMDIGSVNQVLTTIQEAELAEQSEQLNDHIVEALPKFMGWADLEQRWNGLFTELREFASGERIGSEAKKAFAHYQRGLSSLRESGKLRQQAARDGLKRELKKALYGLRDWNPRENAELEAILGGIEVALLSQDEGSGEQLLRQFVLTKAEQKQFFNRLAQLSITGAERAFIEGEGGA